MTDLNSTTNPIPQSFSQMIEDKVKEAITHLELQARQIEGYLAQDAALLKLNAENELVKLKAEIEKLKAKL